MSGDRLPELARREAGVARGKRQWLPLLVGLAIGLRAALAVAHPFLFPDSADYDALGRALVEGKPYFVGGNFASRMPGYPVLVAMVYWVCGYSLTAVLVVQAVLGGIVVALTYALGRRVGEGVGVVAAALAAVDPLSVGFSASLLTEIPFTAVMMAALLTAVRMTEGRGSGRRSSRWGGWVLLGVLWAVGVYLRASALWAIVLLAGWVVWAGGRRGRAEGEAARVGGDLAGAAVAVGIVFMLLMPWLMRNYARFHTGFFRLTTLEGISLYEAVYPGADGGPKQDVLPVPAEIQAMGEAERNDEWGRRGWAYVREEPLRVLGLAVQKLGRTWSPWLNAEGFRAWPVQAAMVVWHVPLYLFAILGLARRWPAGGAAGECGGWLLKVFLLIPVLYFSAVHALYLGSVRYRTPLMPLVCVFAAAGVLEAGKWLSGGKRSLGPAV